MDPREMVRQQLPGSNLELSGSHENLDADEVRYLYSLTEDEDLSDEAYARAKDMSLDVVMTNFVRAYKYEDQVMAGDIVAPVRPTRSKTGSYKTRGKEALSIAESDEGSQDGNTSEIAFRVGSSTYANELRKLKIFVSDDEVAEAGPINAFQEATVLLRHAIDLRQEVRIRNLAEATTVGAAAAGTWDTGTSVNTDITTGINAFVLANGQPPTHIQFNYDVANEMVSNISQGAGLFGSVPSPLDAAVALGQIDASTFFRNRRPWGLNPVVTNVMYDTADDPEQTSSPAYVWPDNAYIFRVDRGMRSSGWAMQTEQLALTIVRWRDEDRGSGGWFLKALRKRDELEVTSTAIYEITTVT
jgi:hypothetical protein